MQKKQHEVLKWASSYLMEHGREANVADLLLQYHLDVSREVYLQNMQINVPEMVCEHFMMDVKRHVLEGVPVQHMMGYEYFYGRKFKVNEHVLVPRMETEELVLHVIETVKQQFEGESITLVDVGTGSGVIAITLALELENVDVVAVDISQEALVVARENAKRLEANVTFLEGDFLQPVIDAKIQPHIIVSNPPYIKLTDEEELADTVVDFDPHLALFGGVDGLDAYRKITAQTTSLPREKFCGLYYEIGYNQANEVKEIVQRVYPASDPQCIKDINQNDRIISVQLNS